jgi:hypothetical protein
MAGREPVWFMAMCVGIAGIGFPPVGASVRTLLPEVTARMPDLVRTAYALESVLQELVYMLGPLLVALVVGISVSAAIILAAALGLAGLLWLASLSVGTPPLSAPCPASAGAMEASMTCQSLTPQPQLYRIGHAHQLDNN